MASGDHGPPESVGGGDVNVQRTAEDQLDQGDEQFRLLVDGLTDYAIFMLDVNGRVRTWNAGAERIKGYTANEILGRHFSVFYPEGAIRSGWPAHELAVATKTGRFEDEGWRVRKDGSRFWANVVITAIHDVNGAHRGFSKITRDLTERRFAEEQLRLAHADLEQRVEQRTAELANANHTLQAEVALRHALEVELVRTVEQLRESDRNKNEFLAVLAHELRNPLAPIRHAVEFLRLTDPGSRRGGEIIERQVRHMARLIDDLLDLSRITRNLMQLKLEPSDIRQVIEEAVEAARPSIVAREHQLEVRPPEGGLTMAEVDRTRLAQVLANLLDNAAKYTPKRGRIWLTAGINDDELTVRVRDTGVGLPPDEIDRVFEMFTRLDRGTERQTTGLGIGLTLAKRLVELHGGTISVESAGPDQGSEFTVRLPVVSHVPVAQSIEDSSPTAPREPIRRRVLVVDDNEDSAEMLATLLRALGCDVRTGYDGIEAVALAGEFHPDVVFLDIGMPRMNGYDVARRIRSEAWGCAVSLVAMTGWSQAKDKQEALNAGFNLHLTKPVDPAAIRAILRSPPAVDARSAT